MRAKHRQVNASGHTQSLSSLAILHQMRQHLDISDDEHYQLLAEVSGDQVHAYRLVLSPERLPTHASRELHGLDGDGAIAS